MSVYFLIPLIGALIGYLTNWVAIRMLFRPHNEKRIFGVRIPFTPGLIPRKRDELAASIGRAVGRRLLTKEVVALRIEEEGFKAKINSIIHEHAKGLLSKELGSINSLIPQGLKDGWEGFLEEFKGKVKGWTYKLMSSKEMEALVKEHIKEKVDKLMAHPIERLISQNDLAEKLSFFFKSLTEEEGFERKVRGFINEKVDAFLQEDKSLGDYIPSSLKETAYVKLEEVLPFILDRLVSTLEDERVRKRIKLHLYELVDSLITQTFKEDSLWDQVRLGLLEAFVISQEEIKLRIDQALEEAAPRIAALIRQDEVKSRIYKSLTNSIDSFLERRVSDFNVDEKAIESIKERLGNSVLGMRGSLIKYLTELLGEMLDFKRPIKEFIPGPTEAISDKVSEYILALLKEKSTLEAILGFIKAKMDELLNTPIGKLEKHIPQDLFEATMRLATEGTAKLLKQNIPKIMKAIDVEGLVREKVGEFSTKEVEQLIVGVTGDQLKAITWFGAVLGFLIGLVQLGVMTFSPSP
jgi:uncharacterized membrane protein YheB (UPF0754 family)